MGKLIEPLGILTLTLVVTTVSLGFLMPRNRQRLFKWHRGIAITTLVSGLCHGTLVLLLQ